ncbi:cupin domain-containing protein [Leucobacter sp. USHLN153]|uniref:cupin domain-containing protein n=1 Tax=Leucobacter sp. USHLN153 TaxID=3081268 RepID=UPI003017E1FC
MNVGSVVWTPFVPVAAERVTDGSPEERIAVIEENDRYSYGLWEVTPGRFTTKHAGDDEVIHIVQGHGVLRSQTGDEITIEPGAIFVMPDGYAGEWEIHEAVRKTYVQVKNRDGEFGPQLSHP